ncbi:pyrroloquinoline quinone biosynthesis protein PqqE [Streptomyces sp. NPDC007851]|uniref:pyrroloquinoline quinone biosynthesis protein PqqE n=1 Tax=Streptomyces sp. NPDC007851 TaxID=3155008 RepID=UPI0033F3CB17
MTTTEPDGAGSRVRPSPPVGPPWALLAELTHACPLRCGYCSNPVRLIGRSAELTAGEWAEVFRQAGALGVVQTHLSGGEPLLRRDLPELVAAADAAGLYTQLVTSGVGLGERRLARLAGAGLRSVQLSVQHTEPAAAERIAGVRAFAAKERAARLIRAAGLPFGLNVVLHRGNLDAVEDLIALAVRWGADRIELANVQYHGWAARNRAALLPLPGQVERARETVLRWRERLDEPELVWVAPDLPAGTAKPCMGGWGRISLTVAPDGTVLPCPAAAVLPGLDAPDVREHELAWIWAESKAFNAYRGESWMRDPCRGCALRATDFGGCRCQAYALTGDARNTDPACRHAPDRHLVSQRWTSTAAEPGEGPGEVRRGAPGKASREALAAAAITEDEGGGA